MSNRWKVLPCQSHIQIKMKEMTTCCMICYLFISFDVYKGSGAHHVSQYYSQCSDYIGITTPVMFPLIINSLFYLTDPLL